MSERNKNIQLPATEAARVTNLDQDLQIINDYRKDDYNKALEAVAYKFSRMGIHNEAGDRIQFEGTLLNDTYINILQNMRKGSNISLAMIHTLNRFYGRNTNESVFDRLDQAHRLSSEILMAINGRSPILGGPDKSIKQVTEIGIFNPYKPTLELIVNGKGETKKVLKALDKETEQTSGKSERVARALNKLGNNTLRQANIHDDFLPDYNIFEDERKNVLSEQQNVFEAVRSREPLSRPVQNLADQIIETSNHAQGAINASKALKEVLKRVAIMSSLQAEQAALIRSHRAVVVSLGIESFVHTTLPFYVAEIIAHEIERAQLINLHILLQIQREMLGYNPDSSLRSGVAPRVLSPQGLKNRIIDAVAKDAK